MPGRSRGLRTAATGRSGVIDCYRVRGFLQSQAVLKFLGSIKTKPALSATIGKDGEEKQDPIFQNPAALGAMHVHASAAGTRLVRMVDKESKDTPHRDRIISRSVFGRNTRRNSHRIS